MAIDPLQRYEALLDDTHDPAIEQQIKAVKSELLVSPARRTGAGRPCVFLPGLRQDRLRPLYLYEESAG